MIASSEALAGLIGAQLPSGSAAELTGTLRGFASDAATLLGDDLVGVYLTGSFASGEGDAASDVDFVVVSAADLRGGIERRIRELHRNLPVREGHWTRHLEGSWTTATALRGGIGEHRPWLYVDNGAREMELSRHDDSPTARWTLHRHGFALIGPEPAALLDGVPAAVLRADAMEQATARLDRATAEPAALVDPWAQTYAILTHCRLLFAAERGELAGKRSAATWVREELASDDHARLIDRAVADRIRHAVHPTGPLRLPSPADSLGFLRWATDQVALRAASH